MQKLLIEINKFFKPLVLTSSKYKILILPHQVKEKIIKKLILQIADN